MKRVFKVFITLLCVVSCSYGQGSYPVPESTPTRLFYIQHSNNHNTYVYDARMKGLALNQENPIDEYRIIYTKGGIKKPLSELQKHLAYGLISTKMSPNLFELHLAASKKLKFYLTLNSTKKPVVYTIINNHKIYLDRMFIDIKDGSTGLNTKVQDVVFEGRDFDTGKKVTEKVILD